MGHEHRHSAEGVTDHGLLCPVGLNIGLSASEVAAGPIAGCVALLADTLHNFNVCAALFSGC